MRLQSEMSAAQEMNINDLTSDYEMLYSIQRNNLLCIQGTYKEVCFDAVKKGRRRQ